MNALQENQFILLLSDYVPIMDGDIIKGISPEANELTRQKLIENLNEELENFSEMEPSLLEWYEKNISLLETISDQEFQSALAERIMITEVQIGHSLFEPLTPTQLDKHAEKFSIHRKDLQGTDEKAVGFEAQSQSILKNFFKGFRQK